MFTADPAIIYTLELAALAAIGIVAATVLKAWRGWLDLRKLELSTPIGGDPRDAGSSTAGSRIEIADLKERIRKLEAIAAGVDL